MFYRHFSSWHRTLSERTSVSAHGAHGNEPLSAPSRTSADRGRIPGGTTAAFQHLPAPAYFDRTNCSDISAADTIILALIWCVIDIEASGKVKGTTKIRFYFVRNTPNVYNNILICVLIFRTRIFPSRVF